MRHFRKLVFLALATFSGLAVAQGDRAESWEMGFSVVDTSDESVTGDMGSRLDFKGDTGWGFWGAYNFTNRLAVQIDWSHMTPDYSVTYRIEDTLQLTTLSHTADVDNIHVKGTFYFLEGNLTPFVEAGFGWTWVDSNIADGPPTTGCWWDPWWGYICQSFYDTYEDTNTSYTYSAGLRWDFAPGYMLRAEYGILDVNASAASGSAEFEAFRLTFGWRF